jgi:NADPH2:quinone reductase
LSTKSITYQRLGGPDAIEIITRTVRPPAVGEVRLTVKAAAVNPTDVLLQDPGYGNPPFPITPGMDAAGIIESVGPGVTHLRVGDEVMAGLTPLRPDGGAQAAHFVVPAASVVPIPRDAEVVE